MELQRTSALLERVGFGAVLVLVKTEKVCFSGLFGLNWFMFALLLISVASSTDGSCM